MKKLLTLTLTALLALSLVIPASAARDDVFTAAYGTPTIDGKMDDAYLVSDLIAIDVLDVRTEPYDKPATGWVRVLWDDGYIYLYCEINDPTRADKAAKLDSSTDCVDFFLCTDSYVKDGGLKDKEAADVAQFRAVPYVVIADEAIRAASWGGMMVQNQANASHDYIVSFTETGYKIEYKFAFNDSFAKAEKAGRIIGFGVQINDDTNNDNKRNLMVYSSNALKGMSSDKGGCGELKLVKAEVTTVAPETTAAPATTAAPVSTPATADAGVMLIAAIAMVLTTVLSLRRRAE